MTRQNIVQKVISFSSSIVRPGASVVVAVSGGADSVALLFLLHELQEQLDVAKIVVAHINYGLRCSESDDEEALVRQYAVRLQVPVYIKKLHGHQLAEPGMENWARKERYAFLSSIRIQTGCTLIATGHTLDDQAETVLMRLMRGTGLNGMRGIVAKREDGVVRPLLSVRKQELVDWLNHKGIEFCYDSSNDDRRFLRNGIRHELLPLLEKYHPGTAGHIAACAMEAQHQWNLQRYSVDEWTRDNCRNQATDTFSIRKAGIHLDCPAAEAIRGLFVKYGIPPTRTHIDAVFTAATHRGGMQLLPGGWRCTAGKYWLYFEKTGTVFNYLMTIPGECVVHEAMRHLRINVVSSLPENLDCGKDTIFIDGNGLGLTCVYRSIATSDEFIPFGRSKKVNVLQFLSKQGLPEPDRRHTGILTTHDHIPVWIPGIRIDDRFRITTATKKVIKVQSSSIL